MGSSSSICRTFLPPFPQVITPFRKLILCAENRKEMEDWIGALKSVQKWEINEVVLRGGPAGRAHVGYLGFNLPISLGRIRVPEAAQAEGGAGALSVGASPNCCALLQASQFNMEHFSGMHNWYACSHARPTFCNVCREALPGVTSHGLSCEGRPISLAAGQGPSLSFLLQHQLLLPILALLSQCVSSRPTNAAQ